MVGAGGSEQATMHLAPEPCCFLLDLKSTFIFLALVSKSGPVVPVNLGLKGLVHTYRILHNEGKMLGKDRDNNLSYVLRNPISLNILLLFVLPSHNHQHVLVAKTEFLTGNCHLLAGLLPLVDGCALDSGSIGLCLIGIEAETFFFANLNDLLCLSLGITGDT